MSKTCPNCSKKMKQQFRGLYHCKCGVSWMNGRGFFDRTSDMAFCLGRKKVGKKIKRIPYIRTSD